MFGVDLLLPNPGKMNHCETIRFVLMTEQHVVLVSAICKRLDRASKKQMTRRKLALEFGVQPLRLAFGRIPAAWQWRTIGWLRLHEKWSLCA